MADPCSWPQVGGPPTLIVVDEEDGLITPDGVQVGKQAWLWVWPWVCLVVMGRASVHGLASVLGHLEPRCDGGCSCCALSPLPPCRCLTTDMFPCLRPPSLRLQQVQQDFNGNDFPWRPSKVRKDPWVMGLMLGEWRQAHCFCSGGGACLMQQVKGMGASILLAPRRARFQARQHNHVLACMEHGTHVHYL